MIVIEKRKYFEGKKRIDTIEIDSIEKFILEINNYYNPVDPYIGIPLLLEKEIERLIAEKENQIFKCKYFFTIYIKKFMGDLSRSRNSQRYWIVRGYSPEKAKEKVSESQSELGKKFSKKRKDFPELYSSTFTSQIGYWKKRGFSEEDSLRMVSKVQSRFSLSKCIEKYGEEKGKIVWEERQEKWQESLKLTKNIKWKTSSQSNSFESYINRYGDNWICKYLDHRRNNSYLKKETLDTIEKIIEILESGDDLESHINNLDILEFKKWASIGIVNFLLNTNYLDLVSKYMETNLIQNVGKSKYGNIYYCKGKYYKSDGEYEIGKYLESMGIDFKTQISYKGTGRFTDFYIPSIDTYFELTGMKNTGEEYENKRKQLKNTHYKIIWSNDPEFIKKYIYEKIHKEF
jgi:hypothetical protein